MMIIVLMVITMTLETYTPIILLFTFLHSAPTQQTQSHFLRIPVYGTRSLRTYVSTKKVRHSLIFCFCSCVLMCVYEQIINPLLIIASRDISTV